MRTIFGAVLAVAIGLAVPGLAQDRGQTLADIRQELSVLYVEIQTLKTELSTTGAAGGVVAGGNTTDRLNAIEGELSRLIGATEKLEFRINSIVKDGTNRIGDLEFRLCELEEGCDISAAGQGGTLGGGAAPTGPVAAPSTDTSGQMAMGEQVDFDAAMAALESGAFEDAAARFASFTETYTGGPLTGEAHYRRGEALEGLGRTSDAARSYLTSFSGSPNGARAPDALYKLGTSLGTLGQTSEACVTLAEVGVRFPSSPVVAEAEAARQGLACQ
ncbi:tol-pal system protein YbgF [Aliiroseovarius subalbicans]|uniref:tol-pal system protein YbgF n=1 Tax=Aliiroseovarius subalbicans TaxID=2925840 RepID=UPI001F57B429|nr:tol-pal system protein YbgF [Aliiroseovarius subalbicans]MCI2397943.1 tol-pal system protein YbgF [Aliiroseovarius subalbicans]